MNGFSRFYLSLWGVFLFFASHLISGNAYAIHYYFANGLPAYGSDSGVCLPAGSRVDATYFGEIASCVTGKKAPGTDRVFKDCRASGGGVVCGRNEKMSGAPIMETTPKENYCDSPHVPSLINHYKQQCTSQFNPEEYDINPTYMCDQILEGISGTCNATPKGDGSGDGNGGGDDGGSPGGGDDGGGDDSGGGGDDDKDNSPCNAFIGNRFDVGWKSAVHGKNPGTYWCATKGGGCQAKYVSGSKFCGTVTSGYDCIADYEVIGPECNLTDNPDGFCSGSGCGSSSGGGDKPGDGNKPGDGDTPGDGSGQEPGDGDLPADGVEGHLRNIDKNIGKLNVDFNKLLDRSIETNATLEDQLALMNDFNSTVQKTDSTLEAMANYSEQEIKLLSDIQGDVSDYFDAQYQQMKNLSQKLSDLNADLNANFDQLGSGGDSSVEIKKVVEKTEQVAQNTEKVAKNTAESNALLSDIKNELVSNRHERNAEHQESMGKLEEMKKLQEEGNSHLEGIGDGITGLNDLLSDFGNPDISGAGQGTCIQSQTCSGFYTSNYPGGMAGIIGDFTEEMTNGGQFNFLNQFQVEGGGDYPETGFSLDFGKFGNFGRFNFEIGYGVWGFIRACILFSAALLCRRLVFGG